MYLETAIEAAQKAGAILIEHYGKLKSRQISLKGARDYVTEIDKLSEKEIIQTLKAKFPDHSILAEESGEDSLKSEFQWIIDPLDGTINYIHEFPMFSVSIALEHNGKKKVGVIYDPLKKELFYAQEGKGAFLNDQKIQVSQKENLKEALLATGFPFLIHERLDPYLDIFRVIFSKVTGIRRAGSAAIDLAYTACGRFDGFWEMGLSPWDIAAGILLVEEAGGRVSGFHGEKEISESGDIVCGNPKIHPQIIEIIQNCGG